MKRRERDHRKESSSLLFPKENDNLLSVPYPPSYLSFLLLSSHRKVFFLLHIKY